MPVNKTYKKSTSNAAVAVSAAAPWSNREDVEWRYVVKKILQQRLLHAAGCIAVGLCWTPEWGCCLLSDDNREPIKS